jgi:hypothetical protein
MKYASVTIGSARIPWPAMAAVLAAAPMLCVMGLRAAVQKRSVVAQSSFADVAAKGQFVSPTVPRQTPESEALALTFNSECTQPFGPSPMVNKAPAKPPPPKDPPPATTASGEKPAPTGQPPSPPKPPTLTVTSIMTSQGQPYAVINSKIRKVGDSVGRGFKIISIDGTSGQVVIGNGKVRSTLQLKRASDGE